MSEGITISKMEVLELEQGSDLWLEERLNHNCASEAAVVMGDSPYMTRNQLLDMKRGWQKNPDPAFKKRLYQRGHDHEAQARPITEMELCENLEQAVGKVLATYSGETTELLASYDGIDQGVFTGRPEITWEHKDWNATLAENVRNGVLEPLYYWQLEQQCLVAGTGTAYFTCSDGTENNRVSMWYQSVPERRLELIKAWIQFDKDLAEHEVEAKQEKVLAVKASLPALTWSIENGVIVTNAEQVLETVRELAETEINRPLETALDFGNKEQLIKAVKAARSKLKETVEAVRGEFVSYAEFEKITAEFDTVLMKMQTDGEKKVKAAKEAQKQAIQEKAAEELTEYVEACTAKIQPFDVRQFIGVVQPDFASAMKGKRNLESLQAAVDQVVADKKIEIETLMETLVPNIAFYNETVGEFGFLFGDINGIATSPAEAFKAVVTSRIAEQKQKDQDCIEAEAKAKAEREERKVAEESQSNEKRAKEVEAADDNLIYQGGNAQKPALPLQAKFPEKSKADDSGYVLMPRELTAENGAKKLLIGEFFVQPESMQECPECEGYGEVDGKECECCEGLGGNLEPVPVPWQTIKGIYDYIVKNMGK